MDSYGGKFFNIRVYRLWKEKQKRNYHLKSLYLCVSMRKYCLTLSLPKSRQNVRLQFSKNVKSKLYYTENSKTRGQTVQI